MRISNKKILFKIISAVKVVCFLSLFSVEGYADMFGFFKRFDVHLSPEVHGRVTFEGQPLAGLKVVRGLTYGDDDELLDKTMTNSDGGFSLGEKNIKSRRPGSMFDNSSVRQVIVVEYEEEKYVVWYTRAIGITPEQALTEKLNFLRCELTTPEISIEFPSIEYPRFGYLVHSICRW